MHHHEMEGLVVGQQFVEAESLVSHSLHERVVVIITTLSVFNRARRAHKNIYQAHSPTRAHKNIYQALFPICFFGHFSKHVPRC
jgi:hypothetical protein